MQTLIALLRAVNVGGTGKLPMADLRAMAKRAGLHDPRTYIQTGNLLFRTDFDLPTARAALAVPLATYAGRPVGVILRTSAEMRTALEQSPFAGADPRQVVAIFLEEQPDPDALSHARGRDDEEAVLGDRVIYVHYPSGQGRSKLAIPAAKVGTARNMNTVAKLVEMAEL